MLFKMFSNLTSENRISTKQTVQKHLPTGERNPTCSFVLSLPPPMVLSHHTAGQKEEQRIYKLYKGLSRFLPNQRNACSICLFTQSSAPVPHSRRQFRKAPCTVHCRALAHSLVLKTVPAAQHSPVIPGLRKTT